MVSSCYIHQNDYWIICVRTCSIKPHIAAAKWAQEATYLFLLHITLLLGIALYSSNMQRYACLHTLNVKYFNTALTV